VRPEPEPYTGQPNHMLKISVAEPKHEPHNFDGAGAVTQCGSGYDGSDSKLNVLHKWIIEIVTK
jgi:hypothetical protein